MLIYIIFLLYFVLIVQVRLPSGTVVNVKRYSWGNNVEMKAPSSDAGKTEGMCGNFNGIGTREDEFSKGGDGNPHGTDVSFGDSWRYDNCNSSLSRYT